MIGWPDTRQHQELGRVDGTPAQDDLALRPDRLAYPIPDDLDPARSIAFDYDAGGDRRRQQFEISAPPGRLYISNRSTRTAAVGDVGVEPAKALGDIGIEVVHHREACLSSGREERLADWQSTRDGFTVIGPLSPCHSLAPRVLVSAFLK